MNFIPRKKREVKFLNGIYKVHLRILRKVENFGIKKEISF